MSRGNKLHPNFGCNPLTIRLLPTPYLSLFTSFTLHTLIPHSNTDGSRSSSNRHNPALSCLSQHHHPRRQGGPLLLSLLWPQPLLQHSPFREVALGWVGDPGQVHESDYRTCVGGLGQVVHAQEDWPWRQSAYFSRSGLTETLCIALPSGSFLELFPREMRFPVDSRNREYQVRD